MTNNKIERLYNLWCELYIATVVEQKSALCNAIIRRPLATAEEPFENYSIENLILAAHILTERIDQAIAIGTNLHDTDLLEAHSILSTFEYKAGRQERPRLRGVIEVEIKGQRYLLVPPAPGRILNKIPDDQKFTSRYNIGLRKIIGLKYDWLKLPREVEIDWQYHRHMRKLNYASSIRMAVSPLGTVEDSVWHCNPDDGYGLDDAIPVRCLGIKLDRRRELRNRLRTVLKTANDAGIHILLLPELMIDQRLLQFIRAWLRKHYSKDQNLLLIVAGSRHYPQGKDYWNYCTVLLGNGQDAWEQKKCEPFFLTDNREVEKLAPNCAHASLFEPSKFSHRVVVRDTHVTRIATPICLDYISDWNDSLWAKLAADLYLVPAMSPNLRDFHARARVLGRQGASTLVANATIAPDERSSGAAICKSCGHLRATADVANTPVAKKRAVGADVCDHCGTVFNENDRFVIYLPGRRPPRPRKLNDYLFEISVEI